MTKPTEQPDWKDPESPEECEKNYLSGRFCGCCGGNNATGVWCQPCRLHLGPDSLPLWERTYLAVHGVECPYAWVPND